MLEFPVLNLVGPPCIMIKYGETAISCFGILLGGEWAIWNANFALKARSCLATFYCEIAVRSRAGGYQFGTLEHHWRQ